MYQLYRDRPFFVLCMVIANILLSGWCIYADPVVNNDGITYMSMAQMFLDGKWADAFDYYSWPFYSMFIAATSALFFVELETAAYLLNTLFVTSLTLAFVCIVGELSNNNKRIILIAMVVILLFPSISKYRSFIIRDFGYLSCYLWSLYFIFRFCSTLNKKHLIGWLLFAVLSCLFRFEGIVFLLIAPYFLFLFTATKIPHRRAILSTLSVIIMVISCTLLYWYLNDKYNTLIESAKQHGNDIDSIADLFFANLQQRFGEEATVAGALLSSIGDISYELVRRMAIFYFAFAVYAYFANLVLQDKLTKRVWLVFAATNIVVLTGFSIYNSFLVSRYTMATALTLLILAPFTINQLWSTLANAQTSKKIAAFLMFCLLGLASVNGLNVVTSKTHIKEAGQWMHTNLPAGSSIYSNNRLMVYYSHLDPDGALNHLYSNYQMAVFINNKHIYNFDFISLETNPADKPKTELRRALNFRFGYPLKIIEGNDGNSVFIYQTANPVNTP